MRRFASAILFFPVLTGLVLTGCASMPQVQITMPGARTAYRGPSLGSMGGASQTVYGAPAMGGATQTTYGSPAMGGAAPAAYRPQAMGGTTASFPNITYSDWGASEPDYRFYPGDVLTISASADPTLNGDYTVAPDGRIAPPWISPVMVAGQSIEQVRSGLWAAYSAAKMRNPNFNVAVKTASSVTVYVGGEVQTPGEYPITGDANAMQAVIKAGGAKSSARTGQVVILRKGQNGQVMQRTANLSANGGARNDLVPLRRGDVVFVPKTSIAEVGTFMAQIRDALPIQFGYNLNGY